MIEIYLLEQLTSFAKHGTLSAASEELHISQPALTRSMKKLEEVLGVTLFERQKNRLYLNDTGKLAVDCALRVLAEDQSMADQVRSFDRSLHTVALGCCAPVPSWELTPRLQQLFTGMTVSNDIRSDDQLLETLSNGSYQLIVTHHEPEGDHYCHVPCGHEQLFISLPPAHPLASFDEVSFRDLEDVPLLQYTQVGFWFDLVNQKIPNPHFLLQNDRNVFTELISASALPNFVTDYFMKRENGEPSSRKILPISDREASVTYYLVCKASDKKRFQVVFDHLPDWCRR